MSRTAVVLDLELPSGNFTQTPAPSLMHYLLTEKPLESWPPNGVGISCGAKRRQLHAVVKHSSPHKCAEIPSYDGEAF